MSDVQDAMLDSIARKIASLQMQQAVHLETEIQPDIVMTVLCTAADLLRGDVVHATVQAPCAASSGKG